MCEVNTYYMLISEVYKVNNFISVYIYIEIKIILHIVKNLNVAEKSKK